MLTLSGLAHLATKGRPCARVQVATSRLSRKPDPHTCTHQPRDCTLSRRPHPLMRQHLRPQRDDKAGTPLALPMTEVRRGARQVGATAFAQLLEGATRGIQWGWSVRDLSGSSGFRVRSRVSAPSVSVMNERRALGDDGNSPRSLTPKALPCNLPPQPSRVL